MEHQFNIDYAQQYGVDAAILIRHFQYWIIYNRERGKNQISNRTWTYFAISWLQGIFPYWTHKQLRRIVNHLVNSGVLLKRNYNKKSYDKTNWYAFVEESRFLDDKALAQMVKSTGPNGNLEIPKQSIQSAQTGQPIPNTKTNTLTDIKKIKSERSQKILELDLKIAKGRNHLCNEIDNIFYLNAREKNTFARAIAHIVKRCQVGELDISIFYKAVDWAKIAANTNSGKEKGLFIAKIKKETGFTAQKLLLNV